MKTKLKLLSIITLTFLISCSKEGNTNESTPQIKVVKADFIINGKTECMLSDVKQK